jgi:hypothetical protein
MVGPPMIIIAYNPDLISKRQYAKLVALIGDLSRAEGGMGIKRLKSRAYRVLDRGRSV